jgi:hypothetical protein
VVLNTPATPSVAGELSRFDRWQSQESQLELGLIVRSSSRRRLCEPTYQVAARALVYLEFRQPIVSLVDPVLSLLQYSLQQLKYTRIQLLKHASLCKREMDNEFSYEKEGDKDTIITPLFCVAGPSW